MSADPGIESADFYIVLWEGKWKIRFDGKFFGPCATERIAIQMAKTIAQKAKDRGLSARVLTQQPGNTFSVVWTSDD